MSSRRRPSGMQSLRRQRRNGKPPAEAPGGSGDRCGNVMLCAERLTWVSISAGRGCPELCWPPRLSHRHPPIPQRLLIAAASTSSSCCSLLVVLFVPKRFLGSSCDTEEERGHISLKTDLPKLGLGASAGSAPPAEFAAEGASASGGAALAAATCALCGELRLGGRLQDVFCTAALRLPG